MTPSGTPRSLYQCIQLLCTFFSWSNRPEEPFSLLVDHVGVPWEPFFTTQLMNHHFLLPKKSWYISWVVSGAPRSLYQCIQLLCTFFSWNNWPPEPFSFLFDHVGVPREPFFTTQPMNHHFLLPNKSWYIGWVVKTGYLKGTQSSRCLCQRMTISKELPSSAWMFLQQEPLSPTQMQWCKWVYQMTFQGWDPCKTKSETLLDQKHKALVSLLTTQPTARWSEWWIFSNSSQEIQVFHKWCV